MCDHHQMYFESGNLFCVECGADRTPYSNERMIVVFDNYREKILHDLEKIVDGLPEDVLHDIEQYAEYLKWRRSR
jgi:hypothetical protein